VKQGHSTSFGAIGFGLGKKLDRVAHKKKFDAIFSLEENEWKDTVTLQLQIRDIQASND
jgi:single-stranded-DNA-specific exonuclease